jgi:hypothetical protein
LPKKAEPDFDANGYEAFKTDHKLVRCVTCKTDPHIRAWIETKIAEGESLRSISAYLKTQGTEIAPGALNNHRVHIVV